MQPLAASHGHKPRLKPWGHVADGNQYYLKLTYITILGQPPQWAPLVGLSSLNSGAPRPTARVGLTRLRLSSSFMTSIQLLKYMIYLKQVFHSNRGKLHQS